MAELPAAILFDADGTLYDSERLNHQAHVIASRELHSFEFTWELYDTHIRQGSKAGHEVLLEQGLEGFDPVAYQARKLRAYDEMVLEKLETMPGLVDFLDWCQGRLVKCLVVSAAGLNYIERSLTALGISDYFEAIVSGGDIGDKRKPHPAPYLAGLKLAAVEPNQALVVEDTAKGIKSAQAAGLRVVAIRNDANNPEELSIADHMIENYDELKDYLLR